MSNKLVLSVLFQGVDKMSGGLRNIVGLGNKGSKSLKGLSGEARKLTRELSSVQRELAKGSGNVSTLIDRERALERQLQGVNIQLERQKRLVAINADQAAMARRGEDLKSKGVGNVTGGATMSAPIILAAKAAADFSSGMVDIRLKANLTNRETEAMARNIMLAAEAARQMSEDMRAGVDVLSGFGLDPRIAAQMIAPIGKLGTAFKVEIADGAAAAYANLNNLKVSVGETGRALDVMAAAGNAGAFEVKDMARHFPGLTAQMQALGQKGVPAVADLSAALQIARRGSGDADEAANNVKNLLSKINSPGVIKAFEKNFGVDLPAALRKAYAKGKTPLEAIAEITKQATGGDLSKLGFAFEDMQAQSAVRSLILDLDDFRKMRAEIAKSGGTTDKAFSVRAASDATVNWRAFLGTASRLAIVLGTTLLPVMTEVLGNVASAATVVANWAQAHPQLAGGIMKAVAALVTLRIGIGVAQYAFGAFLGPFSNVLSFFRKVDGVSKFGTLLGRFGSILSATGSMAVRAFGLIRTAMMFLAQGVLRAGAMMLANPIVLIITAIVVAVGAAAYLIYTHWDKIKAAFFAGVNWVKQTLSGLPAWLKNIGSMMMQGLLLAINPMALAARLLQVARNGITAFKNYFGIKSPSRLFMAMGGHINEGLAIGIDKSRRRPTRAVGRMAAGVAAAGAISLAPMQAAARPGAAGRPAAAAAPITIHVHAGPGMDVKALAREVGRELERAQAVRARSDYGDR